MTKRIALLVEHECQDEEVYGPLYVARAFGWEVTVAGWIADLDVKLKRGAKITTTTMFVCLEPDYYDAVIIPGGWGAERLRCNQDVLNFVHAMHEAGKVIAAICHGPWVLCSADLCERYGLNPNGTHNITKIHRRMTSYPGCKDDLVNAGAEWVDQPVVTYGNLVTAQHYRDVPQFMNAIKELLK